MSTKAQRFKAEEVQEKRAKAKVKAGAKPNAAKSAAPGTPKKPHNLSERAGRAARVAYETSSGRPSRRSTRKSAHHQRAASQLERTQKLAQGTSDSRAARAQARTVKVRGKR
jgi:hypothetical protein